MTKSKVNHKAQKTNPEPTPNFENGTIVTEPSLVVDAHGVHWWVDPNARIIRRV